MGGKEKEQSMYYWRERHGHRQQQLLIILPIIVISISIISSSGSIVTAAFDGTNALQPPEISEQFSVNITEVDDTTGSVSLRQTLFFDMVRKRSHMVADGTLVGGHLEQIKRCDLRPQGFFIDIQGTGTNASEWRCFNSTIKNPTSDCEFEPFWSVPSNATYDGTSPCDGDRLCDTWSCSNDGGGGYTRGQRWPTPPCL